MRIAPLALTSLLVACSSANTAEPTPATQAPVTEAPTPPAAPPTTPPAEATNIAPPSAPPSTGAQVRVVLTELPEGTYGMPQSGIRVVVTHAGAEQAVDVGTLANCTLAEGDQITAGSLATVNCWWAGAGDTIEVVTREDALIVTRQEIESESEEDFPVRELGRVALNGASVTFVR